jgi:peptidoglycan/xylan/chitin deacetylase (PgdA/CDA1 family)
MQGAGARRPDVRRSAIAMAALALLCALAVGAAPPAHAQDCAKGYVALTFDDGPTREMTDALARILEREQVPATFFMVGEHVDDLPGKARKLARRGHAIYNHTYSHARLTDLSDAQIRQEVWRARQSFNDAGLPNGRAVRPPFLAADERVRRVIRNLGYATDMPTYDTEDWEEGLTAAQIVEGVRNGLEPNADYLLHDHQRMETIEALPDIITMVRDDGYCFGQLDETGRVVPPDEI